jgi:hypothetical protein
MSWSRRPSRCEAENAGLACRCRLSESTRELADLLAVSRSTIDQWLRVQCPLAEAVCIGRDLSDGEVADWSVSKPMARDRGRGAGARGRWQDGVGIGSQVS